ncbi:MAG: hypothetical protein M3Z03_09735 [Actinomycetota bacterium]|nr:hypothetical protein [Actinomycetota bacterium]
MQLAFDDDVRYRHCETCDVEWFGAMACWWCGDLTPPLPEDDWLADIWSDPPVDASDQPAPS